MLHFLRKHQKYFFFVITVVVVASFSFFGTYDTLAGSAIHEQVAFTTIDGNKVTRGDLDAMVAFLGTDNDDKRVYGGAWGPNFLNDGVIKNDILSTGLGEILAASYPEIVGGELASRLDKEKRFSLYTHPQAKFISVESAWDYFAPAMKMHLKTLRKSNDPLQDKAFAARVGLYLNERQFPAPLLRQVLRYQQQQQPWVTPDPKLEHMDLSLFGYHTVEDWFGPKFVRVVSEFIINSSELASQKGYEVSKAEALADLMRNAEISFQQNTSNPQLGVSNSTEYMNEQLRLLGMDRSKAVRIWQKVLLFRRLFQDVGNAVLVDALSHQAFNDFAKETISGEIYRLPPELRLRDYKALQKFETYLYAVAKRARIDKMNDKELLAVPTDFLTVEEIKKKYPELIQKQYTLEIAQVNKNALQSKISLKDTWSWEAEEKNWGTLKKEFPELGVLPGTTRKERIAALDSLDDRTRARLDHSARAAIVDAHPEWIDTALKEAEKKTVSLGISLKGGRTLFTGVDNREELLGLLDKAELNVEPGGKLTRFTGDNISFYKIGVLERSPNEEILTFAQANQSGALEALLDQNLEAHYTKIRESDPAAFQKDDKSWKSFADVKDKVADRYFDKLLKAIQQDAKEEKTLTGDRSASLRLHAYMQDIKSKLQQGDDASQFIAGKEKQDKTLANQWQIEKAAYRTERNSEDKDIDSSELFKIAKDQWTGINSPANGDLYFFQLQTAGTGGNDTAESYDTIHQAHTLIADDAQRNYMYTVVNQLKEAKAISLDYLSSGEESIGPEEETSQN